MKGRPSHRMEQDVTDAHQTPNLIHLDNLARVIHVPLMITYTIIMENVFNVHMEW